MEAPSTITSRDSIPLQILTLKLVEGSELGQVNTVKGAELGSPPLPLLLCLLKCEETDRIT